MGFSADQREGLAPPEGRGEGLRGSSNRKTPGCGSGGLFLLGSCDTFDAGPKAWLCGPATLPVVTSPPVARPCRSLASDSLQCIHCMSLRRTCQVARSSDLRWSLLHL